MNLPREKGSSAHNPADPLCKEYTGGTEVYALCEICLIEAENAREKARAEFNTWRTVGS